MNLSEAQIFNLEGGSETSLLASHKIDYSSLLLDWIVDNSFLSSEVFESNLELSGQKFFRFSISSMDNDGNQYHGFGRSKDRLQAASIAAGEVIERFIAKNILKSSVPFFAKHQVNIHDSEISVDELDPESSLPSPGFHSSNGWAVHFSLKRAIENSALEALERHTLLYSYLHSGWNGFKRDHEVPFKNCTLTPYISRFHFGGFGAGIVTTEGSEFPGQTFGYLCESTSNLNKSQKWLNAFFESYGQWESFSTKTVQFESENLLAKYQNYFLMTSSQFNENETDNNEDRNNLDIKSNILVLDIKKTLNLPVPFYAAFTFGGSLIPLFFRQKLSNEEVLLLQKILKSWDLPTDLPEYHPIL